MGFLIFVLVVWVMLSLVGAVVPQMYIGITKWKMGMLGKILGFEVVPKSDEVVRRGIRVWCAGVLAVLLIMLWIALI